MFLSETPHLSNKDENPCPGVWDVGAVSGTMGENHLHGETLASIEFSHLPLCLAKGGVNEKHGTNIRGLLLCLKLFSGHSIYFFASLKNVNPFDEIY